MYKRQDELLALAATVPDDDTTDVLQTAGLFFRAGNMTRALREFQIVLKNDPSSPAALTGAGTCAYQLGDYRVAEDYLSRAQREGNRNAAVSDMLETVSYTHLDVYKRQFGSGAPDPD